MYKFREQNVSGDSIAAERTKDFGSERGAQFPRQVLEVCFHSRRCYSLQRNNMGTVLPFLTA